MICFEIFVNGKKICTAGIDSEFGVLTSIVTWVKRDLTQIPLEERHKIPEEELDFNVGGPVLERHGWWQSNGGSCLVFWLLTGW